MTDGLPVANIEEAMEWIYTNMFRARTEHAMVRFDAIADRKGIAELIAEYEGEWSMQEFDQLNDIETVIIRRADIMGSARHIRSENPERRDRSDA